MDPLDSPDISLTTVETAYTQSVITYVDACKGRIPEFVDTHFSFRGAFHLHKKALGRDIYRGPLNMLWAVPSMVFGAASSILKKCGAHKTAGYLEKLPRGFQTDVQNEVNWLIYTELLQLPCKQANRESKTDALLGEILKHPKLSATIARYFIAINANAANPEYRNQLEANMQQYASSRTAAADLAGSVVSLSAGFVAFHKLTPGVMATGTATATVLAQHIAVSNFWLGTTLGGWYYTLFPATASTGLVMATTGSIMAALAIISTFAGIIVDPLQAKTGLHERRLIKLVNALKNELLGEGQTQLKLKDHYVARVFDLIDLLRIAART